MTTPSICNNMIFLVLLLSIFLVPSSSSSSSSSKKPSFKKRLEDWFFPRVTVSITNDASHDIPYMCNSPKLDQGLHALRPKESIAFEVVDIMFPLVWCYAQLNDRYHGVFWAFATKLGCADICSWSLKDEGAFYLREDGKLEEHRLFDNAN
ncbi:hypothetical protein Peur_001314 [Populus x canadensis]